MPHGIANHSLVISLGDAFTHSPSLPRFHSQSFRAIIRVVFAVQFSSGQAAISRFSHIIALIYIFTC